MENKPQNVFDRLDSIEASQIATQAQNEEILGLLRQFSNQQVQVQKSNNVPQQLPKQEIIKRFVRAAKKEFVWFGTKEDFNKSKFIVTLLSGLLLLVGVLSTIFTSIAFKMYSTFSLFENIWLIFACFIFAYSRYLKKRVSDTDLRDHSVDIFMQDADGVWRDTCKEKKRFRWFRRISYVAVVANIIVIWIQSKGAIAITATLFELAFMGLSIGLFFANVDFMCLYNNFIVFTGKNIDNTKTVVLVFDVMRRKLMPIEEMHKIKDYM